MAEMSIDQDQTKDHSEDSAGSSAEADAPAAAAGPESQLPKRKGGRKPIYATSEERKQRNRQAQAAFRERRTEYIKQLEEAIRVHEQNLANLQTAHRHAADECLMLRYKNSLLERILLEKGIDVQSELQAKTGGPSLGPTHMAPSLVQPPPIQRAILNRHHARRSTAGSTIAPKLEQGLGVGSILPPPSLSAASTPKSRPTPSSSSHATSPTTTASYGASPNPTGPTDQQMTGPPVPTIRQPMKAPHAQQISQVAMVSAMTQHQMQQQQQQQQQVMPVVHHGSGELGHIRRGSIGGPAAFYQTSSSFPNHIEQLEQGFHAPDNTNMLDELIPETPGPGPRPPSEAPLSSPIATGPPPGHHVLAAPLPPHHSTHPHLQNQAIGGGGGRPRGNVRMHPMYPGSLAQMFDGEFDFDPFGLSASMAFPTPFTYDTSSMR